MLDYKIYNPNPHVNALADWGLEKQSSTDLAQVLSQPVKIAAIPVCCTDAHIFSYHAPLVAVDWSQFDLVLLSDIEYYSLNHIEEWIKRVGIKNYRLNIGGWHQGENYTDSRILYRPWWAFNLMRMNQPQIINNNRREFLFDCLLGARRAHRDFAMFELTRRNLLDQGIATYRDVFQGESICDVCQRVAEHFAPDQLLWPYVSGNLDPNWEVSDRLTYSISPFVPWNIYRHTWYSIVSETVGYAPTFFFSEKTTKVMYAQRVSVWLAPKHFLKNLRKLGFQTFSSVIDESYDNIDDPIDRWTQAIEQIAWLQQQDPILVYSQLQPQLQHNYQWLTSWPGRSVHDQQLIIASAIQNLQ